jgi:glycosyltransferase involved in cell wall biosynthesis
MKIGIDARFLTHPQKGGFKTYTENLISALAHVDTENEYILYLDRAPDQHAKIPEQSNFSMKVLRQLPLLGMPWREQVALRIQIAKDHVDLFHSPCLSAPLFLGCPLVITIHDMIWLFPEKYSQPGSWSWHWKLMQWYNMFVPSYASKSASAIITVSEFSKGSIIEHLRIDDKLIFVTHEGPSHSFRPIQNPELLSSLRMKYGLDSNFVLAIGSADPRKNIATLMDAYAMLPEGIRENYRLVIVWTAPFLAPSISKRIESLGLNRYVQFLDHVSNEDLVLLYNEASLFVFPSLFEGFGLPPLEAMACGTPVVASNNSSIPETVGDAALLFDAQDVAAMSSTILKVLSDDVTRQELITRGLNRSGTFSWEECARETLAVYKTALRAG